MNKKLLALAIGAAATLPALAVAGGPTIYGKMNVTLESAKETTASVDTKDQWELNSNASRLGVKGDAETGITGVTGIYQAEYEIDVDDGTTPFKQRNIFAGVKGPFGTVKLGKMDTPVKESQGKIDEFNDYTYGDIKNIMAGEVRADNVILYTSPKIADAVSINVALIPAEGLDIDNADGDNDAQGEPLDQQEAGIADSVSASVVYEKEAFYAALAIDQGVVSSSNAMIDAVVNIDSATASSKLYNVDIVRLVAQYKADSFEIGGLYQTAEDASTGGTAKDTSMVLSGAYMTGDWKFKGQYGTTKGDTNDETAKLMGIGADYKIGKSTTATVYYVSNDFDKADKQKTALALGLEQKF